MGNGREDHQRRFRHRRVKQAWRDPEPGADAPDVPRNTVLHGYELTQGESMIVVDADLKAVRLENTKRSKSNASSTPPASIASIVDQSYFLVPSGKKNLQEPYSVIRDAMAQENHGALGRVAMTGHDRIVAIEMRHRGLLLTTLRITDEVRDEATAFDGLNDRHVDPAMTNIARAIIAKQANRPTSTTALLRPSAHWLRRKPRPAHDQGRTRTARK